MDFSSRTTVDGNYQTSGYTLGKFVDGRLLGDYKATIVNKGTGLMITEPNNLKSLLGDLEPWDKASKKMAKFDTHQHSQKYAQLLTLQNVVENDPATVIDNTLFTGWPATLSNDLVADGQVDKSKVFYHIKKIVKVKTQNGNEKAIDLSNTFYWLEFAVTIKGKKRPLKAVSTVDVDEVTAMLAGMTTSP
jgi:hypothetical protein